jgi:acyl-CoA reductase-like NAD-dependent aldehyde dehydrogenase
MSVALKRFSNHIGGKAADSSSGETIDVVNPATGEVIAAVPNSTAEDIDHAVEAAERAFFGDWGETTPAERFEILNKLADALDEHAEELGELESLNVGKPRGAAVE